MYAISLQNSWRKEEGLFTAIEPARHALLIPLCFGIGVGVYFLTPPAYPLFYFILSLCLFLLWFAPNLSYGIKAVSIGLAVILFAISYTNWRAQDGPRFVAFEQYKQNQYGVIKRIDRFQGGRYRYWIDWIDDEIDENKHIDDIHSRGMARLYGSADMDININDLVRFEGKFFPPDEALWPDGFSFRRYAWFQNIAATGYITRGPFVIAEDTVLAQRLNQTGFAIHPFMKQFKQKINGLRDDIAKRLQLIAPNQAGALAIALSVGDRSGLNKDFTDAMRKAGLAHLLAISGLHMGLAAAMLFQFIRWIMALLQRPALLYNSRKWAAFIALPCLFIYLLLAGSTAPTQRAFMMTAIALMAIMLDRRVLSLRPLFFAALVILLIEPSLLISPSFQLSFAAVLALIGSYENWQRQREKSDEAETILPHWLYGFLRYSWLIMRTSLIASLATAPLVAWHFGYVSAIGLVANLFAIPLMGFFIMPLLCFTLIAMPFGLDGFVFSLANIPIDALIFIAHESASLPLAQFQMSPPNFTALMIFLFCAIIGAIITHALRYVAFGIGLIALLFAFAWPKTLPDIIIAEDGDLMAIRYDDALWVNDLGRGGYVQSIWQQRSGLSVKGDWQDLITYLDNQENTVLNCTGQNCLLFHKGQTISILQSEDLTMNKADACKQADFFIHTATRAISCDEIHGINHEFLKQKRWVHFHLDESKPIPSAIILKYPNIPKHPHPWQK